MLLNFKNFKGVSIDAVMQDLLKCYCSCFRLCAVSTKDTSNLRGIMLYMYNALCFKMLLNISIIMIISVLQTAPSFKLLRAVFRC